MGAESLTAVLASVISALAASVTLFWFRRSANEVTQLVAAIHRRRQEIAQEPSAELPEYLRELAALSPAAAIVVSWHELEAALKQRAEGQPVQESVQDLINSIQQLRNKVVHGPANAVDRSAATEVAGLAFALSKQLGAEVGRPTTR